MGRRSERLSRQGMLASDLAGEGDVIQVVSRAFDVLRCFESHEARLGNLEISNRCGLPRSTVSRLTHTLTRMGQLVYLPRDQKYRIGPSAVAMSTSMMKGLQLRNLIRLRLQDVAAGGSDCEVAALSSSRCSSPPRSGRCGISGRAAGKPAAPSASACASAATPSSAAARSDWKSRDCRA